mmetsp:Transcript_59895/g.110942  ORF Transcript_59895/g.110942 Transcript_59895/m.110942 type:complete len:253 (+) Transcript_59895:71-829(+)
MTSRRDQDSDNIHIRNPHLEAMASKNLLELTLGIRFTSSHHWAPNPLVGVSALFFGVPACAFAAVEWCILNMHPAQQLEEGTLLQLFLYPLLTIGYLGAVCTCALADYFYIKPGHRSYFGKVDIIYAGSLFIFSNFDFVLRASVFEAFILSFIAILSFFYSGCSKSPDQWFVRHTIWHLTASMIGTYGAFRRAPESEHISKALLNVFAAIICFYAIGAACCVGIVTKVCTAQQRDSWWQIGAQYAQWKPVAA